jgi:hypothetical protein
VTTSTLTEGGWPRPIINGWPIPWVTPSEDLRQTDPDRMAEVVERGLCEVCGEPAAKDELVYLLVNLANGPIPDDLSTKVVQAMDNAVMHERCMRLAVGRCPCLRKLRTEGDLVLYRVPWEYVWVYTDPDDQREVLGVDGEHVERVSLP